MITRDERHIHRDRGAEFVPEPITNALEEVARNCVLLIGAGIRDVAGYDNETAVEVIVERTDGFDDPIPTLKHGIVGCFDVDIAQVNDQQSLKWSGGLGVGANVGETQQTPGGLDLPRPTEFVTARRPLAGNGRAATDEQ
jgi:hypothetical protein